MTKTRERGREGRKVVMNQRVVALLLVVVAVAAGAAAGNASEAPPAAPAAPASRAAQTPPPRPAMPPAPRAAAPPPQSQAVPQAVPRAQTPAAPQRPQLTTVTLPEPLARVLADYETAWRAKDAAALAALFTEDGFVLSSGSSPARGRAEIEKRYTGQGGPLWLRAFSYSTDGSIGWILGAYTGRGPGAADEGKFTLTLRKTTDGRWLINSDMDNYNSRP